MVEITDVSGEFPAYIFRIEEYAKYERASSNQITDWVSAFLRNVGKSLSDYTASYSRIIHRHENLKQWRVYFVHYNTHILIRWWLQMRVLERH